MKAFLLTFIFLSALIQFGHSIYISEIHANPQGNDKNLEWIEVYNDGSFSNEINFSNWRFYEQETNHKLSLVRGSDVLREGEYAVVAQDAIFFLDNNLEFSGNLFDSSWGSLKNSGEYLAIKDENENIIAEINYSEVEEGKSVCFDGEMFECDPSPGVSSLKEDLPEENEEENSENLEEKEEATEDENFSEGTQKENENIEFLEEKQKGNAETVEEMQKKDGQFEDDKPIVILSFSNKLEFNNIFTGKITAENTESVFIHIEDSNKRKISETARFYGQEFSESFEFLVYSSCESDFLDPYYLVAYFGEEVNRQKVDFIPEECDNGIDDLEERFPEELTGNVVKENIFQKIWGFILSLFS